MNKHTQHKKECRRGNVDWITGKLEKRCTCGYDELKAENKQLKKKIKDMMDYMKPFKKMWDDDNVWDEILKDK